MLLFPKPCLYYVNNCGVFCIPPPDEESFEILNDCAADFNVCLLEIAKHYPLMEQDAASLLKVIQTVSSTSWVCACVRVHVLFNSLNVWQEYIISLWITFSLLLSIYSTPQISPTFVDMGEIKLTVWGACTGLVGTAWDELVASQYGSLQRSERKGSPTATN